MKQVLDYNSIQWGNYFYLDSTSPSGLRWKVSRNGGKSRKTVLVSAGDCAGWIDSRKNGDLKKWRVSLDCKAYLVHRIIYVLIYGEIDRSLVVDHLNGDGLDNSPENLKLKTPKGNSQNKRIRRNNTSGSVGVWLSSVTDTNGSTYSYWVAQWANMAGEACFKRFSGKTHGYSEAKQLAINYRKEQIILLNTQGAEYTTRHQHNV